MLNHPIVDNQGRSYKDPHARLINLHLSGAMLHTFSVVWIDNYFTLPANKEPQLKLPGLVLPLVDTYDGHQEDRLCLNLDNIWIKQVNTSPEDKSRYLR